MLDRELKVCSRSYKTFVVIIDSQAYCDVKITIEFWPCVENVATKLSPVSNSQLATTVSW
jgi:hypothetical protein